MLGLGWLEVIIITATIIALFGWQLPEVGRSLERGLRDAERLRIIHPRRPLYEDGGGKWGAVALGLILFLLLALTACIKLGLWR